MNIVSRNFKVLAILIGLFLNTPDAQPAGGNASIRNMHIADIALGAAKIICANIAMQEANAPGANNARNTFLAADVIGLARNGVALYTAISLDQASQNNGNIFAFSSSTMTLLIDMYMHIKNDAVYTRFTSANKAAINAVQAIEFSINLLSKYGSAGTCQTPAFKTSMHNVEAAFQAVETYLLSEHCTQDNETVAAILSWTLASIAVANGVSAVYYGVYKTQQKVPAKPNDKDEEDEKEFEAAHVYLAPPVDATPAQQQEWLRDHEFRPSCVNDDGHIVCPMCLSTNAELHDGADENVHLVRLGCNHLSCQECVRGKMAADLKDPGAADPVAIPDGASDAEIAALLHDEGVALEGARKAKLRAQRGKFNCPVCREPSNVREILEADPEIDPED